MARFLQLASIFSFLLLTNCNVLQKVEQCEELALLLQESIPELKNLPIKASPSPDTLRNQARVYATLAQRLEKINPSMAELQRDRKLLVQGLLQLERELKNAATAVSEQGSRAKPAQVRRYARSKKSILSIQNKLKTTLANLNNTCN